MRASAVVGLHVAAQVFHHRGHGVVVVGVAGEVEGVDLRADAGHDRRAADHLVALVAAVDGGIGCLAHKGHVGDEVADLVAVELREDGGDDKKEDQ